jgi:Fic family protein
MIKVGQGETAYWSFVPNPLPPQLEPSWDLANALSEADRAVSELAGLGRMLSNPNLFIRPFLRREAVLSSRIEGTHSDLTDLYVYEGGQLSLPGLEPAEPENDDLHEVYNYVRTLEAGLAQLEDTPISLWMLRGLHKILLNEVRGHYATPGEFRTRQNWIGGSTINNAIYVPPPVIEMTPALESLEHYFYPADLYPPLVRLAFIHYQFEAIHPFVDGNGRIGRLLLSMLLVSWKLLPLPLLHLSAYIEAHRQEYYDLLLAVSQKGGWQDWVLFFLRATTAQAQDTGIRIKRIQDLQQKWHGRLIESRAAHSVFRLSDFLFEAPIITIPTAQKVLDMTYHGAERSVNKLIQLGMLSPMDDRSYGKTYLSKDILETILGE